MITIKVEGLEPLRQRFGQYPQKFNQVIDKTLEASLLTIHENVPPYPVYPSSYRRTGTLGRSIGVGNTRPDIYEKKVGSGMFEATFGSRLNYAPFVIGETTQAKHMGHWWTLDGTVYRKAAPKIERLFKIAVDRLAAWLDGKGST